MTKRATFTQADAVPPCPPEAVLEAAREIGRLLARRALDKARGAAEPRAMPIPERAP